MSLTRGKDVRGYGPVVEGAKELADEPKLVAARVVTPRATKNDELDFVHGVTHLVKGRQARRHLQVRIEEVLFRALAGRLVREVALRHAQVVGAVQAVAGTWLRTSEHGDGSHTGRRAARLHAKRAQQAPLQPRVHGPPLPTGGILLLHA